MEYGIIGETLGHSFSGVIHPRLFGYTYEKKELKKSELEPFLKNRDFKGINVTIPYKESVIPYLDFISDEAKEIGAVNTIVNKEGRLLGYNTDYLGLKALILKENITLSGKKVLILGSGGTSKTASCVARDLGAAEILRVSRKESSDTISYETAKKEHTDAEIIINTTPCGMYPNTDTAAITLEPFKRLCAVIDVVYNPLRSKLVIKAQNLGIKAAGGLYMLVSQAVFAGEKFTGKALDPAKTDEVYLELLRQKQNIVLCGMPSSGKTTVGKALSKRLNKELVDTDSEIIKRINMPIADYFEKFGEESFRDIEAQVIKEISVRQGIIIATGGGSILRKENVDFLKNNGRIYFLDRALKRLISTASRPLSSNKEALEKRYLERYPLYKAVSDKIIDANGSVSTVSSLIEGDFSL